ncbi:hypothetical protein [Rhodoblastus sp.]|uniref:hypothetical protein n=1 Tax=Rhodoblastus sp. TaxID=1962975 RepID=UPI003F954545
MMGFQRKFSRWIHLAAASFIDPAKKTGGILSIPPRRAAYRTPRCGDRSNCRRSLHSSRRNVNFAHAEFLALLGHGD